MKLTGKTYRMKVEGMGNDRTVVHKKSGKIAVCVATCNLPSCRKCRFHIERAMQKLKEKGVKHKWTEVLGQSFVVLPKLPEGKSIENYISEMLDYEVTRFW